MTPSDSNKSFNGGTNSEPLVDTPDMVVARRITERLTNLGFLSAKQAEELRHGLIWAEVTTKYWLSITEPSVVEGTTDEETTP
jgi:hypothetical protein